jgi:Flp pilus assembly protein TadG
MLQRLFSHVCRLHADDRGVVLIKFAVALLPLLVVVGVALDLGQIMIVKQKLNNAIDAAGIAVGRHPELDDTEVNALAQSFVQANYPAAAIGDLKGVAVESTNKQVDVTATASVGLTFLRIVGYESINITVSSRVMRQLRKIELVMVLDNSGSMAGTRINALKSAANDLVNALFGTETTSENVKIGLVPFTAAVNVGAGHAGAAWLDTAGISPIHKEDIDVPAGKTLFDLFGNLTNAPWGGCVKARVGTNGYDLTDEPPDPMVGETLFVPFFAPDEPKLSGYVNDYLDDGITGDAVTRQRNWSHYQGKSVPTGSAGPNYNCPASPILPLSNVKDTITAAIKGMVASGNTVIPEGIAWGWRVLSPDPPFTEGAPSTDKDTLRFLVLLTDGENNVQGGSNGHNKSVFSAFGYAASGHLGSTDGSATRTVLDAKTAALCTNVKAHGIYVYTIALALTDSTTLAMLANCATPAVDCPGGQCYYNTSNVSGLGGVFTNIALGINQLRVAQ